MAGTLGPFSYTQYMAYTNEPIIKETLDSYIKNRAVFTLFDIENIGALKKTGNRIIGGLPNITYVPIGTEPANPFVQDPQPYEEGVYFISDNFDIDRRLLKSKNYIESDPTAIQIRQYMQARAFDLNYKFFNNDHLSGDINAPVGIHYRLAYSSDYGNNAAVSLQSTADLSSTGSGTNANNLYQDLDFLFDRMGYDEGEGLMLFVSPQVKRRLAYWTRAESGSGGFNISKDQYDRSVTVYKKAEIHSVGYNAPTQAGIQITPNISDGQDVNGWNPTDPQFAGGTQTYSTIYAVSKKSQDFNIIAQDHPQMEKTEIFGTRKWRIMFDMSWGIWNPNTRGIGRLFGVKENGSAYS